ncbi:MAG: dipeptide epimerase [Oscillatoriaceae cyanobacterium]
MRLDIETFTVHKRFPLTISRGTTAQTTNVWVRVSSDGIEGWGEASPFSAGGPLQSTEAIAAALQAIAPLAAQWHPLDRQQIETFLLQNNVPSAARAALDVALHDWLGKKAGLPLWRLWGLERPRIVPTSVTIGINPPEIARERVRAWLQLTPVRALKVKLGSPEGIEADRAMLTAIRQEAPADLLLSVDANGGWNLDDAVQMCQWLATFDVKYVEQPLPVAARDELSQLYAVSPLPIFVDESCFTSRDVPALADRVHGINIKLMKCGGLAEAIRTIHAAHTHGLQVMFGCYSDSTLANTAMSHLAPLANYLDLDSHLNLVDDQFVGSQMQYGCLVPNDLPGLGVTRREN